MSIQRKIVVCIEDISAIRFVCSECKKISLHTLDSPPPSCQHVIAHSNDPMLQLYSLLHNSKTHASRVFQLLLEVDE